MANQQRQGRQNGGGIQAAVETAQNLGHRLQEGASRVDDRVHEEYDAAREGLAHGYKLAEGAIARNPGQATLIGLGVGVGVGLGMLVMVLLTQRDSEPEPEP